MILPSGSRRETTQPVAGNSFPIQDGSVRPHATVLNLSKVSNGVGLLGPSMGFSTLAVLKRVGVYVKIYRALR